MLSPLKRLLAPRPHRFARRMLHELEGAGFADLTFDAEGFRLVSGELVHNLHNLYAQSCRIWPWQRGAMLRQHAQGFALAHQAGTPRTWDEARQRLFPVVRDRYYLEAVRLQARQHGHPDVMPPHRELTDRLCVTLVVDHPTLVQLVTAANLEEWSVSFEQGLMDAQNNLEASTRGGLARLGPGVYGSSWGDDYDAARILVDEVFRGLEIAGHPVVLLPHKNALIVTGSDDAAGLARAFALAEAQMSHPHAISVLPWVRRWPRYEPLELEPSHPAFGAWRRLRVLEYFGIYADQAELLQTIVGEETFVASYTATEDQDTGTVSSYCVWSNSVPTLLPKTEQIGLFDPERGSRGEFLGIFPWDTVARHCGELLQATGEYPPRYRVQDFPTESTLEALRTECGSSALVSA